MLHARCPSTVRAGNLPLIAHRSFARPRHSPATLEPPTLVRFVILSMLLHVLVVLFFGSANGGAGRREDGSWGVLDVTLRRLSPEPGSGFKLAPGADMGSPGAALLRRFGGPTNAPAAPSRVDGNPAAAPPAANVAPPIERAPASPDVARSATEAAAPARTTPFEALPPLNRSAPEEVDKPFAPSAAIPPRIAPEPVRPVEVPPRELPVPPGPPVEQAAPPKVERAIAPVVEPAPREVPITPAPQPVERVAPPPKVEREIAPIVEPAPREVPITPAPQPVERVAPPPNVEREIAPVVEPAPRMAPVEATPERIAPRVEREAPSPATPLPRGAPAETTPRIERVAPRVVAPGTTSTAPAATRTETPPVEPPARLRFGAPDPGEEIFKPRRDVVVPSSEPGGAPRIDLEASRQRAREIASEGSGYRGVVPLAVPPPPADRKTKLSEAIEKALKPDCRDAYASMGLLAVPALVASAIGNGGCRW